MAVCLTASVFAAKKYGKVKEYYTTTTTYDSVTDTTNTTWGYESGKENELKIQEFTQWTDSSPLRRNDYERVFYEYNVPEDDFGLYSNSNLKLYIDPETGRQYEYSRKKHKLKKRSQKIMVMLVINILLQRKKKI